MRKKHAKLSEEEVDQIKIMIYDGSTNEEIAEKFACSVATVCSIRYNRRKAKVKRVKSFMGESAHQKPERCPTCGGRVYMPCTFCAVTRNKETSNERAREVT